MNIQQQVKFHALVQKIERYARQRPAYYKFHVGLLAILGYAYILFVFLLLCTGVWVLRQAVVLTQAKNLIDQVNFLTLILGIGIIRLFWVNFPPPKGLKLYRRQVPQLFTVLDELKEKLQTPPIHHILLNYEYNAAVFQIPCLGFLGWQRNYLSLGLPLMQSVSPEQFYSTLSHELGHLSGNHSRFSGWIYRVRQTWYQLAQRGDFVLFRWFFQWYEPFFDAYSFALRRANEYEADRCTVEIAGVENAAKDLLNIYIHSYFLQKRFWPKVYQQAAYLEEPPIDTITKMLQELRIGIDSQDAVKWLALALAEPTGDDDTHPCLSERLDALGYQVHSSHLPEPIQKTAAEYFFGVALSSFAAYLDDQWKQDIVKDWKKIYIRTHYQRQNLKALAAKAQVCSLTVEEAWKLADLTHNLQGNDAAIALFRKVLAQKPNHPLANYQLGKILLEKYDGRGITYLKNAIELDPDLVIPSCELLYAFYKQLGQREEADVYLRSRRQHYEVWQLVQHECNNISEQDYFAPHDLPHEEAKQIAEQLSSYPEVKEAYLVRKEITVFPAKPLYIIGISRRFVSGDGRNYKHDDELIDQIQTQLNFSGQVHVLIFNQNNIKLSNALRRIPGSFLVNSQ